MAVLLHDRSETAGQKQREALRLPRTSAVVALFAFSSRMDRDSMRLFARTHGDEVRAAAIASTGQEVLELLHGGLRPQVLVLDALLTKPSVTQVLQEISAMQPDPSLCWCPCRRKPPRARRWACLPSTGSCCVPTG